MTLRFRSSVSGPGQIWVVFGRGFHRIGQRHVWARLPPLRSHVFVTAGRGRTPRYQSPPGLTRSISHRACVSPGLPLWLISEVGDGEEEDTSESVCVCVCKKIREKYLTCYQMKEHCSR